MLVGKSIQTDRPVCWLVSQPGWIVRYVGQSFSWDT